jgi:hypothetical protein
MKKLFTFIVLSMLSLNVFSLSKAEFGIDLGAGIVTNFGSSSDLVALKLKDEELFTKPNFGWRLGFEATWGLKSIGKEGPIEPGAKWILQAGISTRGYHYKGSGFKQSLHTFDIQVAPFLFGWHFNFGDGRVGLRPHTGPYASFDFVGLTRYKEDGSGIDEKTSIWEKEEYNDKGDEKRPHQFFDVGWQEGVDVYLAGQRLYLGVLVQEGFMQMTKSDFRVGSSGTHFGFLVRVGYRF